MSDKYFSNIFILVRVFCFNFSLSVTSDERRSVSNKKQFWSVWDLSSNNGLVRLFLWSNNVFSIIEISLVSSSESLLWFSIKMLLPSKFPSSFIIYFFANELNLGPRVFFSSA